MTSVVAQGKTTMARAILRPLNSLFSSSARIKPRTVDSTTTRMVQMTVFFRTMPNLAFWMALAKLSKPQKPRTRPALVTVLKAIRKTYPMGTMMKTAIRMTLGRIQR